MSILMRPVDSSNVEAIGYDSATKTLRVHFKNGGVYDYAGVPAEKHTALLEAKSVGGHLHRLINGAHPARRVS